jgi:hypothetical protein
VINPEKLTLADEHGHFAITNLWERLIELEVTYTGYKPFHTSLRPPPFNNKNDIAIKLVEQSKLLESVDEIGELTNDRIVTTASGSIKK